MFKQYREAYDAMEKNKDIQWARKAIALYQAKLTELEHPYHNRMATAAIAITEAVLETKKTTTLFGVIASFAKGRKSTSWKSVAQALRAPQELILKHTKVGEPKVTIKIKDK